MIDTQLTSVDYVAAQPEQEAVQQYVRALLARQHALDVLDVVREQLNQVWGTIRKLVEGTAEPAQNTSTARIARAGQAIQAKNSYRSLERRREVGIAALHQAERRANAALRAMVAARTGTASRNTGKVNLSSQIRPAGRVVSNRRSKTRCPQTA